MSNEKKKYEEKRVSTNIIRNTNFMQALTNYQKTEVYKSFNKLFTEREKFTFEQDSITYRLLNSWDANGLLLNEREGGKGWRKYNLLDLAWVFLLKELRKFGYSVEKLKQMKDKFNKKFFIENTGGYDFVELYFVRAIYTKDPIYFVVFENASIDIGTLEDISIQTLSFNLGNHIRVSVNSILQNLMPSKNLAPQFRAIRELDLSEIDFIDTMRKDNILEGKVTKKDGKINTLKFDEIINVKDGDKLADILKKYNFQNVRFTTRDGKVVEIKRQIFKKI